MGPHDTTSDNQREPAVDEVRALHAELRVSMTVMLARSQLLRRRIRSGQVSDVHDCVETLATIEWAVRAMEARLRQLEARTEE